MELPTILLVKNAVIGLIGGLISYLFDVIKGKQITVIRAITKVACGGFVSYFFTPVITLNQNLTKDESFISAIVGILGYRIIEFLLSVEFKNLINETIKSKAKDIFLLILGLAPCTY